MSKSMKRALGNVALFIVCAAILAVNQPSGQVMAQDVDETATTTEEVFGAEDEAVVAPEPEDAVTADQKDETENEFKEFCLDFDRLQANSGKKFFPVQLTSDRTIYRYLNKDAYDFVNISVVPGEDSFLYVFVLNTNGEFVKLYPFGKTPDDSQYELVKAGQEVLIPNPNTHLKFGIVEPLGDDIIFVIARSKKFDFNDKSYRDELRPILEAVQEGKKGAEGIKSFKKSIFAYIENAAPREMGVNAIMVKSVQVEKLD